MRTLALLALPCLVAAGCGDLDVRHVREQPDGVPAALVGEWQGSWQSASSTASGSVVLQVQEFAGEPVVNVVFVNPCLAPREYDLVVTPASFELRADGQTVLAATLGEDGRELLGVYECERERGTWRATWRRDLPALHDLGGRWTGTVVFGDEVVRPLELTLVQAVDGGAVQLEGLLDLGELWPVPVALRGTASFRDRGFDLTLQNAAGTSPSLVLSAPGELEPLRVEAGLLHVLDQALPQPLGVVQLVRQGP